MTYVDLSPRSECVLMVAGHKPHWIQLNLCHRGEKYKVKIHGVDGNYITFGNEEHEWTFWNHSAIELKNAFAYVQEKPDTLVEYYERGAVLGIHQSGSMRVYSLTKEPNGECSGYPLHPGGLTVPLSKVNDPEVREVLSQVGQYARQKAQEKKDREAGEAIEK